ncbi:MAG: tetratricopeptide repeat protein, partial [Thermoanaerobaculia bacterium]
MRRFDPLAVLVLVPVPCLAAPGTPEGAAALLEKGIYAEETLGDLDRAMEVYRKVIAEHDSQRVAVAEAMFRLAMCQKAGSSPGKAPSTCPGPAPRPGRRATPPPGSRSCRSPA